MRTARKDVGKFVDSVNAYCKEIGRPIAWEFGGSHLKVIDRTGDKYRNVMKDDGWPLTLATTPSARGWQDAAQRDFRKLGLLPPAQLHRVSQKKVVVLPLSDRIGRALRPELASHERKQILREIKDLEGCALRCATEDVAA